MALRSARLSFSAAPAEEGNRADRERRRRGSTIRRRSRRIRSPSWKPETAALGKPERFNKHAGPSGPTALQYSLCEASFTRFNTMHPIYFDHNATTPLHPRVREAMLPWIGERHGNPSSIHSFGQAARNAVEEAREKVAALIGGRPPEVVFTASGTEANNAVLAHAAQRGRGHLVISAIEHPSIRE